MSRYEQYMTRRLQEEEELERIGKEAYGNLDMVNEPPHYNQAGIECIDAIQAALTPEEFRGYCKGNNLKYTWREQYKNKTEDLRKAAWYLDKLLKDPQEYLRKLGIAFLSEHIDEIEKGAKQGEKFAKEVLKDV